MYLPQNANKPYRPLVVSQSRPLCENAHVSFHKKEMQMPLTEYLTVNIFYLSDFVSQMGLASLQITLLSDYPFDGK